MLFGGNANNGANAGFTYANSNNTPSNTNTNIGSHLCYGITGTAAVPLGKKDRNQKGVGRNACPYRLPKAPIKKAKKTMKRIGHLYEKIISVENLRLADEKARRGKLRSYGVRVHDKNREANILALHEALLTKTFKTSAYDVFTIHEPKERVIYRLPYYPDRIVHHAIMNILEPIWVRTFTHNTYSCVKGRGIEGCARRVERIIRAFEGKPLFCLKIDIRKFYPSMNHDVLKRLVRRKIKDSDLLWLLDEIIDSAPGLPIGNYLSQYLANICMCYFMHWANERMAQEVQEALRLTEKPRIECTEYADDIVFYAADKAVLREVLKLIRREIEGGLSLRIKGNWQIFPIAANRNDRHGRALDYVGYKFFRRQKLVRKSIKQNLCRMTARLGRRRKPLSEKAYKQTVAPWLGWAKHCDSKHLLQTIIPKDYASIL